VTARIKQDVIRRGITRLCHFTPSRNLAHIVNGDEGILATGKLEEDERRVFTATDLERLDGHESHISCSIEYPNAWYFDKAHLRDTLFRDWVVLLIDPKYLWRSDTRFCPRNAAANYGRDVLNGEEGFFSLFADSIVGARGITFRRSSSHLLCCPTDNQAEVLVPDQIAKSDILGIVVRTQRQARDEIARLRIMGLSPGYFRFIIAQALFEKSNLSNLIRSGIRPEEKMWELSDE